MALSRPTTVAEYIAKQPRGVQASLRRVRSAIRGALTGAQETLTYNMPTYKLHGSAVLYFAAWKHHYSVYPVTRAMRARFKADLEPLDVEKGTIRLAYDETVPVSLIERLAKFRQKEVAAREKG